MRRDRCQSEHATCAVIIGGRRYEEDNDAGGQLFI